MANDDQAQADLANTDETVIDPLDAVNSPNGTISELAAYEAEIEAAKRGEITYEQDEEQGDDSADDLNEGDDTDDEANAEDQSDEESDEEDSDETDEGDDDEAKTEAKTSMRPRLHDPEDIAIAAIAKAKGVSLAKATDIYRGAMTSDDSATTDQQQQAAPVETLADVEAKIDELYERKDEAIRAVDVDTQADLEKEIRSLERKARSLAVAESQNQTSTAQVEAQKFEAEYQSNWEKAVKHYPQLQDPNSAMYKRVAAIDAQAKELGDPLFNSVTKPWDFAKKAALETGTPMTKPESSPKTAPKKGNQGSPVKPASGNARTTSADSNQRFDQEIDGLDSLEAYERFTGRA